MYFALHFLRFYYNKDCATKYQNKSMNHQYNEDDFLFKFLLLSSFFRITSLQVIKEKPYN